MTTTTTPSKLVHNRDKVSGFAVYLEFSDESLINQTLIFSEMVNPASGAVIPVHIQSRVVSPDRPSRSWREHMPPGTPATMAIVGTNKKFDLRLSKISTAAQDGAAYFGPIISTLDGLAFSSWKLVNDPLVIEVSEADALSISKGESPRGFFERLHRLRSAEGLPDLPKKGV